MKLRELLIGGVATIALAGAASANDLTFAAAGNPTGAGDAIASELSGSVDALGFSVLLESSAGSYLDSNTVITYTLTGATFAGAVTIGAEALAATCNAANFSVSSGGTDGDDQVTILADSLSGCTGAANEHIQLDFTVDIANGTDASISATVETESSNTPLGGGASDPLVLATWEDAFDLSVVPDADSPEAQLPGFIALDDTDLGDVLYADAANNQYDLTMTNLITGADLDGIGGGAAVVDITITGDFAGLDGTNLNGAGNVAPVSGVVTYANTALGALGDVAATVDGAEAIVGGTFAVSATLDTAAVAGFSAVSASGNFEITREGTDFTFPYTLDGTTAAAIPGTTIRYRISNNTSSATGPVTLQMRSWDSAPTNTGLVTLAASIAAGADLVFTPDDVEALTGAYGVGDFVVNVEADAANNALTANYAMINSSGTTNYTVLQ